MTKFLLKITEKWPAKVLSVAAALIISIFYRVNTLETRSFTVPLVIESNDTLIPISSFTDSVKVSLRGEASGINLILEEEIEAYIDLGKYKSEGLYRIPVQIRKKGNALGVDPLETSVLPVDILIQLDQKITKNIPVFPVFRGTIANGYELTDQSINPVSVSAEGPRGAMESLLEFNTEAIELNGRYEDFSVMVNIVNNNPFITIRGRWMIEYRGKISRIPQQRNDYLPYNETGDNVQ